MITKVSEIFTSMQGEGPYIGYKQLFIRFCKCNLHCKYCDTNFKTGKDCSVEDIVKIANSNTDCHSISLTGGEPLLETEFLKQCLPQIKIPIYLETNATLTNELKEIIDYIDYIAADIKLPSCTGLEPLWEKHDAFFEIAYNKQLFAKIVFDENITDFEIIKASQLCQKYDIELILQPKMNGNNFGINNNFMQNILDKFLKHHNRTRLIPQVHKFIDVR